jgi:predicted dehydrogenase
VTGLVIRHHLADPALQRALSEARWSTDAGYDPVDAGPLLPRPPGAPSSPSELAVVVVDHVADEAQAAALDEAVTALAVGAPTLLVGPTLQLLPHLAEAVGVRPGGWTPRHEIRVRPEPGVDPRLREDLLTVDRLLLADKTRDEVVVLATANVGFRDVPVAVWNGDTGLGFVAFGSDPGTWARRGVLRLFRHLEHAVLGRRDPSDVRVGMIGYGAIGHEHALAVRAVAGLSLAAVSDLNPARIDLARTVADDVRVHDDAASLLTDPEVDLVVVSTPPNSHARWAREALQAGKHVVLEKPMALTSAECDDVLGLAEQVGRLVVVYQNRRFDPDFLALTRLVSQGAIGEVFHLESFVGGFSHPCNYWHSEAAVSGGAIFDWGSHYLDQILDLMPGPIRHVTAANHKRRWHDVTNADQSRVTLHYADGREAEFIHSDLAAATKPKWLVLGTDGAIVGHWRSERVIARTAIGTLAEDRLAPADSPASLTLHSPDGSVTAVAVPPAPEHAFHRELADHLLRGLPMTVYAAHSRRVVAVMEAAEESAQRHSVPVDPR